MMDTNQGEARYIGHGRESTRSESETHDILDSPQDFPFDFANVKEEPLKPTAAVHKNGKLGFNSDAAEYLELRSGKAFSVGIGEGGIRKTLILVPYKKGYPEESKITTARAGDYYYLNLRNFFVVNDVPFEEKRIKYDIHKKEHKGEPYFILKAQPEKPR